MDVASRVIDALAHPAVRDVRLVGSRAEGRATERSDYDFIVDTHEFQQLAEALPGLLGELDPLAEQWDRLSDEMCWMVMLPGPVKVDLIFPSERHEHEPPSRACACQRTWSAIGGRSRIQNPRASCPANGFQDRRLRPLGLETCPLTGTRAPSLMVNQQPPWLWPPAT